MLALSTRQMDRLRIKTMSLTTIVGLFLCLTMLITTSVRSFPQQQLQQKQQEEHADSHSLNIEPTVNVQPSYNGSSNDTIETKATNKTLNSKMLTANATNESEKPVLKHIDRNVQSNETASDALQKRTEAAVAATATLATITTTATSTASTPPNANAIDAIPAQQTNIPWLPISWMANFQPSNALVIADTHPLRIWAIGSISKFPEFIERFVQRIQSYYSIYKYHDLSRPASYAVINSQYHKPGDENDEIIEDAANTESNTVTENIVDVEMTTAAMTYDNENETVTDNEIRSDNASEKEEDTETETEPNDSFDGELFAKQIEN